MEKMFFSDWIKSSEKLAINVKNIEQYSIFCNAMNKFRQRWCTGKSYTENNKNWYIYEDQTCCTNDGLFGNSKGQLSKDYRIIDFKNIIFNIYSVNDWLNE